MKTAIEIAAQFFQRMGASLAGELQDYIKFGYVFVTPQHFMLAREVNLDRSPNEWVLDGSGNCWYVHFASGAGALAWFMAQAPSPKQYVAWRRWKKPGGEAPPLKIYVWADVAAKVNAKEIIYG